MPTVWLAVGCTSPELAAPVRSWSGVNWGSLLSVASMATLEVFSKLCEFTVTIGLFEE